LRHSQEIHGLRAVAIISVLIYHFFPQFTKFNGYLGVDIFFVISGYLIANSIILEIRKNQFSFQNFYLKRFKRIFPAAIVLILLTTIVSKIVFLQGDYVRFFESAISSIFFYPNIFFWRDGGYFGTNDSLKPLLNFWSLGVEEQFYLIFPLILLLIWKVFKDKFYFGLLLLLLLSLTFNFYLLSIGGKNPAFFLTPARLWEFLIGATIVVFDKKYINPTVYFLFLIALLFSFFLPNYTSIPPQIFITTITGFLIIFSIREKKLSSILFGNRIIVFFGKISYSLYLYHWPIIAFLSYTFLNENFYYVIAGIILTLLSAYLSYELIEKKFRYQLPNKTVFAFCLIAVLITFSLFPNNNEESLPDKISASIGSNYRCPISNYEIFGASRSCYIKGIKNIYETETIIIGNSYAQQLGPIILRDQNIKNAYLIPMSCIPTNKFNTSLNCLQKAKKNYEELLNLIHKNRNLKHVIIAINWEHKNINKIIDNLHKMKSEIETLGPEVFITSPIAIPGYDFPSLTSRKIEFGIINQNQFKKISRIEFSKFYEEIKNIDTRLRKIFGENYIKIYEELCDRDFCYFADENESFFADSNHLSKYSIKKLENIFDKLYSR